LREIKEKKKKKERPSEMHGGLKKGKLQREREREKRKLGG
jgi:hypothetical protein